MDNRPLCVGENNTCLNLAGIKGRAKPHLKIRYHTRCDKHRRLGHDSKAFRNPESIRYIPLDKCLLCNNEAQDRHRIVSGSEYTKDKVLVLCKDCHRKVHILYTEFKKLGYILSKIDV